MRRIAARVPNLAGGDEGKCEAPDDARRRLVRGRSAYRELGLPVREGAGRMPRTQPGGKRGAVFAVPRNGTDPEIRLLASPGAGARR